MHGKAVSAGTRKALTIVCAIEIPVLCHYSTSTKAQVDQRGGERGYCTILARETAHSMRREHAL